MIWIWTILCLCIVFAISLYWHKNSKNYLAELGIPYFKHSPFFFVEFIYKSQFTSAGFNLHDVLIERYKKYGRIYGTSENGTPAMYISDPDLLRKILVKDFHIFSARTNLITGDELTDNILSGVSGEKWKRIRTIITPAFSTGKLKRITNIMTSCAETLVENFVSKEGEAIDGKKFFNTFTMDVIASAAFGTKIYSYQDPNNRFVQEANKFLGGKFSWKMIFFILFPKLASYFGIGFLDSTMVKFFKEATLEIVEDRRKKGTVKNDFLQLLMDAQDEHEKEENVTLVSEKETAEDIIAELGHDEENSQMFQTTKRYKALSQNELVSQCVIFFLAGFDTTATTLSCAFYELAVNPDIQEKLRKEIDEGISNHNNQLTYEAIQEMKYLNNFISETVRKYPPVFRLERVTGEDYMLEEMNITLKKGTIIAVPVCCIHQDPEFYPEPEIFNPDRFLLEKKSLRHPYTYLPFGAGPRNCVGMRFALMEIKLCIAYVISRLIIRKCPETKVPMKLDSPLGLLKPHAIFTVEKRET